MKNELQITTHDFLIYRDDNNDVKVNVLLINNDIWLTQNLIAELFGVGRSTVTEHINNILKDGELSEETSVGISDESTGGRKSKIYNTIESDEELFLEYFKMLKSGTIWQQIIGTYFEKNKLPDLFEFLMTLSVLKMVKESSMGINVVYDGDKNKLTQLVNSMCIKMNQLRNTDELKNYPFVEFPKPEPITISFVSKRR